MQAMLTANRSGSILHDPALLPEPGDAVFAPDYWLSRGATPVAGGRGNVLFINDEDHGVQRHWVLRHYRRGGLIGKLVNDQYLWLGAEATRSFREWRLLAQLHAQGLPVPQPVAARYVRGGLYYRADLLTVAIPQARTLTQSLQAASLSADGWRQVGETLARFHAAGVHHADLNANNIVFDAQQAVLVLDFDRGRQRVVQQQWITTVLQRLLRSLNKLRATRGIHFTLDDWRHLVTAHDATLTRKLTQKLTQLRR